jgi:alanine transaminase
MLGRYPFIEPSRCRSRTVGEQQLEQILSAGITTFVSLQVGARCAG